MKLDFSFLTFIKNKITKNEEENDFELGNFNIGNSIFYYDKDPNEVVNNLIAEIENRIKYREMKKKLFSETRI